MFAHFREHDLVWYRNLQNKFWPGTITTEKRSGIWKKDNQVFVEAVRCPGDKSQREVGRWFRDSDLMVFVVVDKTQKPKFSDAKLAKVYDHAQKEYQNKPKLGIRDDIFVRNPTQIKKIEKLKSCFADKSAPKPTNGKKIIN